MSDYDLARFGRAGSNWATMLAALPTHQIAHPWPFPAGVVDGRLVRYEQAPKRKPAAERRVRVSHGDVPPVGTLLWPQRGAGQLVVRHGAKPGVIYCRPVARDKVHTLPMETQTWAWEWDRKKAPQKSQRHP